MKSLLLYSTLALFLIGLVAPLPAQDDESDDSQAPVVKKEKKLKPEQRPVPKALKKVKTYNGKPNYKADYYIFLQSASWCGPCCAEMPGIVEEYPEMKKANVELVLFSKDRSSDDAKAWLKKNGAKFPFAMSTDKDKEIKVPGYKKAAGIPNAIFVDAEGNVLTSGHGSKVKNWREIFKLDGGSSSDADGADD